MLTRQKLRKGIILCSFFIFPAILFYFSPFLIIQATSKGIVNGSFVVFSLLFLSALILGRGYCGWVCPGAGCQEAISIARNKKVTKGDYIKWLIWIPWVSAIFIFAMRRGGYEQIDFFYATLHGLSVTSFQSLIIYMIVLSLIVIPSKVSETKLQLPIVPDLVRRICPFLTLKPSRSVLQLVDK